MFSAQSIKAAVALALADGKPLAQTDAHSCRRNLQFLYHAIVASEPLLRLAIDHSSGLLKSYFEDHLMEEAGHDMWLAEDLGDVGEPHSLAVAMVGSQYYLIQHVHPCALLGYMVLMECFPPAVAQVAAMEKMHGPKLFRTLRHHTEHDPQHGSEVLDQIDQLTEKQQEIVLNSAVQSARYMALASHLF